MRAYFAIFYIDDVDVDGKGDDGDGEQDDGEDDDGGVYTMYATLVEIVESYVVNAVPVHLKQATMCKTL